ncbi:MAG: hypothetical protein ACHQFX_17375, partial [Chitinophagales bacterium]
LKESSTKTTNHEDTTYILSILCVPGNTGAQSPQNLKVLCVSLCVHCAPPQIFKLTHYPFSACLLSATKLY